MDQYGIPQNKIIARDKSALTRENAVYIKGNKSAQVFARKTIIVEMVGWVRHPFRQI